MYKDIGKYDDMGKRSFEDFNPKTQKKIQQIEKDLILQEQVELSIIMPYPFSQIELWKNNAIQFGYIAFFSVSFPPATLWGLLVNIFHIYFIYYSFSDHLKRTPSIERDGIGVWNYIFSFMTFAALVFNIGILIFTSQGLLDVLDDLNLDLNSYSSFVMIVILEHILFIIMFLLSRMIYDKPYWVRTQNKVAKFKKMIDENEMKQSLINQKRENKKKDRLEKLYISLNKNKRKSF